MSEARIGWGGELQISTSASPDGLVEIGEVKEFALPSDEADEVEVTHLKSPDRRKEFIAGLIDGGSVEATINYVPGSASDLLLADARDTGTVRAVRFILPDQVGFGRSSKPPAIRWSATSMKAMPTSSSPRRAPRYPRNRRARPSGFAPNPTRRARRTRAYIATTAPGC